MLACAALSFAATLFVVQRRLVASVARRFARLPRCEQALLVVAVCVTTVCAQKSGVEKVEVESGRWVLLLCLRRLTRRLKRLGDAEFDYAE